MPSLSQIEEMSRFLGDSEYCPHFIGLEALKECGWGNSRCNSCWELAIEKLLEEKGIKIDG